MSIIGACASRGPQSRCSGCGSCCFVLRRSPSPQRSWQTANNSFPAPGTELCTCDSRVLDACKDPAVGASLGTSAAFSAFSAACSSGKRGVGGGGSERALSRRAGGDAARSTYSSALSSGTGSQADSATAAGGGPEGAAAHPEVYAWQAGFEAGQEAAAWAKLPSGSFDGDAHDFMTKSPMKVMLLHAEHSA